MLFSASRRLCVLALCALLAWPNSGRSDTPRPEDALVDAALAARGELAADLLLQIVEADRVASPKRRREIVEMALSRVDDAAEPMPIHFLNGRQTDTRAGYRIHGLLAAPVDALSLRCRAIDALLEIDPKLARAELEQIEPDLGLAPAPCTAAFVADPSRFYQTLDRVVARAFTATERKEAHDVALARRYAGRVASPAQIVPVARFVTKLETSPAGRAELFAALAEAIRRMSPSSRDLEQALSWDEPRQTLADAVAEARRTPGLERDLAGALRDLVVRTLNSPRCPDVLVRDGARIPEWTVALNETIFAARPITADDVRTVSRGPEIEDVVYWRSPKSAEVLLRFQTLQQQRREMAPGASLVEWKMELARFFDALRTWREEDEESAVDYLVQKCVLYGGIYRNAPDDATRAETTEEFLLLLKRADVEGAAAPVTLSFVQYFVYQMKRDARAAFVASLAESGGPTLAAYARLHLAGVGAFRLPADPPE